MEQQLFDPHTVYVRTRGGGFAEYMGGANFLEGSRPCPNCGQRMIREPINYPYRRAKNGYIIVVTLSTDGRMVVSGAEPDYLWSCTKCSNHISTAERPGPKQENDIVVVFNDEKKDT